MSRWARGLLAAALAAVVLGPGSARADVEVDLTDGRTLRARRAERVGDEWVLRLKAGTLRLPASRVREVREVARPRRRTPGFNVLGEESAARSAGPTARRPPTRWDEERFAAGRRRIAGGGAAEVESEQRARLVESPDDDVARVLLGEALAAQGRFHDAIAPLARAGGPLPDGLRRARDLALALSLSRTDRTREALEVLEETPDDGAGTVAALRARLERDDEGSAELGRSRSTHFTLHVPPDVGRLDLDDLLEELESAHDELSAAFGEAPREAIIVVLYPGDEFWETTAMGRQVGGLYDGKIRVPAGRVDPPSPRLRAVLRHELAHAFVDALSGGKASRSWHEGIAEHFEGTDESTHERRLARFLEKNPGSWPPGFSYPTAHARIEFFLRRWGMRSLRSVLRELAARGSMDAALEAVIGMDQAGLDALWGRELVERHGR